MFTGADYYWGKLSAEQQARQLALKRQYEPVSELLRVLLRGAPTTLTKQLADADKRFRAWLELEGFDWDISHNSVANERALRAVAEQFEQVLAVLDLAGGGEAVLVPDTNSLLAKPDPTEYRSVVQDDDFVFMLLPTVLGELDRLKVEHRNPDVREKAKKVITRIKGWRQQGSLIDGVKVDRSITVRASRSEPDMRETLSWLDANVQDDRIIANVLELQVEQPRSRIVLVTADINLQNKADVALIETAELL